MFCVHCGTRVVWAGCGTQMVYGEPMHVNFWQCPTCRKGLTEGEMTYQLPEHPTVEQANQEGVHPEA